MSESKRTHAHHQDTAPKNEIPRGKRLHQHWWFWLGVVLMLTAISVYVVTDNLSLRPRF
jgi:hypothetical protein